MGVGRRDPREGVHGDVGVQAIGNDHGRVVAEIGAPLGRVVRSGRGQRAAEQGVLVVALEAKVVVGRIREGVAQGAADAGHDQRRSAVDVREPIGGLVVVQGGQVAVVDAVDVDGGGIVTVEAGDGAVTTVPGGEEAPGAVAGHRRGGNAVDHRRARIVATAAPAFLARRQ